MTTKVKISAEQVHDGKHVSVALVNPDTGVVIDTPRRLKQGEFAELYVHTHADVNVKEVDGSGD